MVCRTIAELGQLDYPAAVEIIVVVDGSTDGTAEALVDIERRFPLRVIEQPNRGLAAARNRGGGEARHDILLFLDDDMTVEPALLKEHARCYDEGADAVVGHFIEPGEPLLQALPQPGGEPVKTAFGIFAGQLSVKRSVFKKLGGFDESFTANGGYGYEDTDFAHRLLKRYKLRRNGRALTYHRLDIHPLRSIRRAERCARAERLLLAKHPELADGLSEWTGAPRISSRLRRLARIPILPRVLATIAAGLAEAGLRTPLGSSPHVAALCDRAYTLAYWSAVQREGRL